MTNYTATVDVPGRAGSIGDQKWASGYYDLTGAITGHASTGDTITFPNILPIGGAYVRKVRVIAPELDTDGTPTGTIIVGNSDDDNGYIKTTGVAVGLQNSLATPLVAESWDGDLINTLVTNRDIIIEFTAALTASATSGRIRLEVLLEATAA